MLNAVHQSKSSNISISMFTRNWTKPLLLWIYKQTKLHVIYTVDTLDQQKLSGICLNFQCMRSFQLCRSLQCILKTIKWYILVQNCLLVNYRRKWTTPDLFWWYFLTIINSMLMANTCFTRSFPFIMYMFRKPKAKSHKKNNLLLDGCIIAASWLKKNFIFNCCWL